MCEMRLKTMRYEPFHLESRDCHGYESIQRPMMDAEVIWRRGSDGAGWSSVLRQDRRSVGTQSLFGAALSHMIDVAGQIDLRITTKDFQDIVIHAIGIPGLRNSSSNRTK